MDYYVELADHTDIEEAIGRIELPGGLSLDREQGVRRRGGIIQSFYQHPDFASNVWFELRYCCEYRRRLMEEICSALEDSAFGWRGQYLYSKREVKPENLSAPAARFWRVFQTNPVTLAAAQNFLTDTLTQRDQFVRQLESTMTPLGPAKTDPSPARKFVEYLMEFAEERPFYPDLLGTIARAQYPDKSPGLFSQSVHHSKEIEDHILALFRERSKVRKEALAKDIPVPFTMVLESELEHIRRVRQEKASLDEPRTESEYCPLYGGPAPSPGSVPATKNSASAPGRPAPFAQATEMDLIGLAFSGGGIRSATFNLGVLQALAKLGLLRHCDYLSTVSGGGYIGCWFAAWLKKLGAPNEAGKRLPAAESIRTIETLLNPEKSPNPLDERIRPIRYLRELSNYLTPQTGFFSADTWTMISIYFRNALLNQVILILVLASALLLPRVVEGVTRSLLHTSVALPLGLSLVPLLVVILALGNNLRIMDANKKTNQAASQDEPDKRAAQTQKQLKDIAPQAAQAAVQIRVILPLLIVAWLASASYWYWLQFGIHLPEWIAGRFQWFRDPTNRLHSASWLFAVLLMLYLALVQRRGKFHRCWPKNQKADARVALNLAAIVGGAAGYGLSLALGMLFQSWNDPVSGLWHTLTFGAPLLITIYSLVVDAQIGILGQRYPDERREWWSRMRAWTLIYSFAWIALFVLAVYIPWACEGFLWKLEVWGGLGATLVWVWTTYKGVTKTHALQTGGEHTGKSMQTKVFLQVAPYVFVCGLLVWITMLLHQILQNNYGQHFKTAQEEFDRYWSNLKSFPSGLPVFIVVIGLAVLAILFSWRVGVNEFSLHHFYKNRLVRCYLGAARWRERKANSFTGFDADDDPPLANFGADYPGPYPIINTALNLVKGDDLAWQERKASSFVFTPNYCGYDADRAVLKKSTDATHSDAYVPTEHFVHPDDHGPRIGTAMAISGAAASANMGRLTTPASAFLMTMFNIRLGWWLGNPRRKARKTPYWKGSSPRQTPYWKRSSPGFGLMYALVELFGLTNDERGFVNVSDGGHFENLGVYELVRRGCRYIIACDAGQDGSFDLQDLGNVVRKCRTDFGVEIDINLDLIRDRDATGRSKSHCVVGKIIYPNQNFTRPNTNTGADKYGFLVYLKPTITGDEPFDVLEYHKRVPEFPHESTSDQWFSESQFEAYRRLGLHITEGAFKRFRQGHEHQNVAGLFDEVFRYWYPPAVQIGQSGGRLNDAYIKVMEIVREKEAFKNLDSVLFEHWPSPPEAIFQRESFYLCNALIQLMESVYVELNLEDYWDHPHVLGWRQVFTSWARTEPFQETWKIAACTYAERFQRFYNDRIAPNRSSPATVRAATSASAP